MQIHVFESGVDAEGKHIGENGRYNPEDGSIYIDLYSGVSGQDTMLFTAAHELTHLIRQWSPAKFQVLAGFLMEQYGKHGVSVRSLVEEQISKAKRNKRTIDYDTAYEEVVADSMETMLADGKVVEKLAKLEQRDKSLWQKMKDYISSLAEKIRKAYAGLKPDSVEGRIVAQMKDSVEKLQDLFYEGLADAGENFRESGEQKNATLEEGGVKYYDRYEFSQINHDVLLLVEKVRKGQFTDNEKVFLGTTPDRIASEIQKITNIDVHGFQIAIEARQIHHILNDHGENGKSDNSMADPNDIARIGYALFHADEIKPAGTTKAYTHFKNGKNRLAPTVLYEKKVGEKSYYVVQAVPDTKAKTLYVVTAFIGKSGYKKEAQQLINAIGSDATSKNGSADASNQIVADTESVVNQKKSNFVDTESDFFNAGVKYSERVTDKDTLSFLDSQDTITTYKTMQIVDGKLYPPMAARVEGKHEDYSVLGVWEQATEHPELIKGNGKFKLDKGKGQGSIEAAYNPYMHSSNLVINDQFSGAYIRDNLVTVECEVPVSELTSGYHAQYAKDSVGWHAWHTGTVAGAIRKAKGTERQVFLSRWIKPVRIVPDAEVASMYKELLSGTDIAVPDNVVTPSLLSELRRVGVSIEKSGRVKYSDRLSQRQENQQTALENQNGKLRNGDTQRPYSYESLIAKPDMVVTTVGGNIPKTRADVVHQAKQNAAKIGKFNAKDGRVSVRIKDTGDEVVLSTNGLKHGLDRRFDVNAPVTLQAGEIMSNSIRVNELTPSKTEANRSYVLIGAARTENGDLLIVQSIVNEFSNELESMDVLYAINTKKGNRLRSMRPGFQGPVTDSSISIAELLEYVNQNFPDVLPEDVLRHYGYSERPEGKLGESALYSDRDPSIARMNQALEKENRKFREDVTELRKLLALQKSLTHGTMFTKSSVESMAGILMKNADAKVSTQELAERLNDLYRYIARYIARGEEQTWESVKEAAEPAVNWLWGNRQQRHCG